MAISDRRPRLRMSWEQDDDLVLSLAPLQGLWTAEQYLTLSGQTTRPIEFTDGVIEVLPMPTDRHQAISQFLFLALVAYLRTVGGLVRYAPLRLRLPSGRFREPDLVVVRDADDARKQEQYWRGADLVAEVVSPDDPERDTVIKRADYALAGIPEYWIVNPIDATVLVLQLDGDVYREAGLFRRGETAVSVLLPGFAVEVTALLDAP